MILIIDDSQPVIQTITELLSSHNLKSTHAHFNNALTTYYSHINSITSIITNANPNYYSHILNLKQHSNNTPFLVLASCESDQEITTLKHQGCIIIPTIKTITTLQQYYNINTPPNNTILDELAHEIWATAQLLPNECILDGVHRIKTVIMENQKDIVQQLIPNFETLWPRIKQHNLTKNCARDIYTLITTGI